MANTQGTQTSFDPKQLTNDEAVQVANQATAQTHAERDPALAESTSALDRSKCEPLLDSHQAARLLRIHPKTLQRLARNGEIPAIQIGKLWRFRISALNAWITQNIITQ